MNEANSGDTYSDGPNVINLDLEAAKAAAAASTRQALLPWGSQTRSSIAASAAMMDMQASGENALRPGEIVMRTLFADFTQQAEKKIEAVMLEPSVRKCKIETNKNIFLL